MHGGPPRKGTSWVREGDTRWVCQGRGSMVILGHEWPVNQGERMQDKSAKERDARWVLKDIYGKSTEKRGCRGPESVKEENIRWIQLDAWPIHPSEGIQGDQSVKEETQVKWARSKSFLQQYWRSQQNKWIKKNKNLSYFVSNAMKILNRYGLKFLFINGTNRLRAENVQSSVFYFPVPVIPGKRKSKQW